MILSRVIYIFIYIYYTFENILIINIIIIIILIIMDRSLARSIDAVILVYFMIVYRYDIRLVLLTKSKSSILSHLYACRQPNQSVKGLVK